MLSLIVGVFITPPPSPAAPPLLTTITPRGAQRGRAVDLVLTGANFTPQTRLLLPFKATQKLLPDSKPNPAQVRVRLHVDPAVPLGIHPVRAANELGVSPHLFLSVDVLPDVSEVEDNSTFEKAQKVPFPVAVTGQCAGGDVDYFRFPAKKGQRVVIETEAARLGSALVPQLRVTDARRRFLASDDTQKVQGDCRIVFTAPADGDYVVEISDSRYRGGSPAVYRLKIADYGVADEVFPLGGRRGETVTFTLRGGTLAGPVRLRRTVPAAADRPVWPLGLDGAVKVGTASPWLAAGDLPERTFLRDGPKNGRPFDVAPPLTVNGRLSRKGQVERFALAAKPGQRIRLAVQAAALGSNLDGVLRVTDQAGRQLALVDDVPIPAQAGRPAALSVDPFTEVTVPAAATGLMVELYDQRRRGGVNFGYRLTIEPAADDFLVHQPVAEVNVPRGGTAALTVPVTRRGYAGPIRLGVANLPSSWAVSGGYVPEGVAYGVLTVKAPASAQAPAGAQWFQLEGKGGRGAREVRRSAEYEMLLSPDPDVFPTVLTFRRVAVGLTPPEPFAVEGPAAVETVIGYPATVPVKVTRDAKQAPFTVEVTGLAPPTPLGQPPPAPGRFTFKAATAAPGAASVAFTVTAAAAVPAGPAIDLLVQGKAKVNNVDTIVTGPAIALRVRRPFDVDLRTPDLSARPGQTVRLKGRLRRQAVFKEAVQLAVAGLPAGVNVGASPKPVAADRSEFDLELKVDAKAGPTTAALTLTCSTTITGMAYAHPPVPIRLTVGK
jgi:hypothetical protein